jgi:hypothetical protein
MTNKGEDKAETQTAEAEEGVSTPSNLLPLEKEDGAVARNASISTESPSCAAEHADEEEENEKKGSSSQETSSIVHYQDNVPGDGKRLVVNKSKDHGYLEYLTLRRQMKRAFFDATEKKDRTRILNQFLDRFWFVQKDGSTPLSTTEARNKIVQDLFETKTFTPLPKSKLLVPGNSQPAASSIAAVVAASAAASASDDDALQEDSGSQKEVPPRKKFSSWKAWDSDKIVVQYGKFARKNTEYIRFRAAWTDKYQNGSPEQRQKILEDALKRFTFVKETDGRELQYDIAWKKVQKDLGRNLALPSRYSREPEEQDRGKNDDDEETEDEEDEAIPQDDFNKEVHNMDIISSYQKNNVEGEKCSHEITPTFSAHVDGMRDNRTSHHSDSDQCAHQAAEEISNNTKLVPTTKKRPAEAGTAISTPPLKHNVGEKSIVALGRAAKKNEEYLKFRIEWKPKYHAACCEERARIVDEMLRRFAFQRDDGVELEPEAARKKVTKDFFTELRSPNKSSPRRKDSYESESKAKEREGPFCKKSIVQLGDSAPNNTSYWRLIAEWKPKYKVGKSEERKRIVDHILNRFSFVKDGVELSRDDSSKRVAGDLNDQESVCDQNITPSSKNARLRSASNASKSSGAGNTHKSKKSRVSANPPSKDKPDEEREESGKLVVYGGASRGEGNLAYVELLREKKWDYINAETEEDAEKVVDSILEAFIFHNFSPEAARKKVSQGLQEVGERIATNDFRWKAYDSKEKKQNNHSGKSHPTSQKQRQSIFSKRRANRRLSESSDGSSAPTLKKVRHEIYISRAKK